MRYWKYIKTEWRTSYMIKWSSMRTPHCPYGCDISSSARNTFGNKSIARAVFRSYTLLYAQSTNNLMPSHAIRRLELGTPSIIRWLMCALNTHIQCIVAFQIFYFRFGNKWGLEVWFVFRRASSNCSVVCIEYMFMNTPSMNADHQSFLLLWHHSTY